MPIIIVIISSLKLRNNKNLETLEKLKKDITFL